MTYDKEHAKALGADCDHCPLNVGGRFVPSRGPEQASLAFVGEAPGVQEARQGRPFIGPSGRLLDTVAGSYGLDTEKAFLSNACLCRPADGSTPAKLAIAACRPRLLQELQEHGCDTVVALGNSAALSVLGTEGVTKLRVGPGRTSPYQELSGVRVIPTLHPAACLRQSDMFPSLVADVGKVVATNEPWDDPIVRVFDDPVEAVELLTSLQGRVAELVVDIEVDIDKDSAFDHPDRYGLLCVGLAADRDSASIIGERALTNKFVLSALRDLLRATSLVGQNGKFDCAGLYPVLGALSLDFDTMLASYALDERPRIHGLKMMAIEQLGAPQYDEDISKYVKGPTTPELEHYKGYGRIPRPILYKYCGYDCVATFRLKVVQQAQLARAGKPRSWPKNIPYEYKSLRQLHDFLVEVGNELMFLELNGIKVDLAYNKELHEKYAASLHELEQEIDLTLISAGYQGINPRSPKQVKEALSFFRINAASTNEETMRTLLDQLYGKYGNDIANRSDLAGAPPWSQSVARFVETLLVQRREQKMFGTYVKGIRTRTFRGRVYPNFLLHGTTTGRLACRNPNMQNIPRESAIKQQFVPSSPDRVFVQADYSQAELRVLSWLAQDSYFRGILNDPARDLFDELTPILYPELPGKILVPQELWKDIRVRVKAFVYGLGYGRTWISIAREYKMPDEEAQKVTARFFDTIPEIVEWQKWVKGRVRDGNDLINPFGRHRRFHLITEENWKGVQNEALAFLPQSTSSDVCLRALVNVRRDLRGSGAFVRNVVHDSILVDCDSSAADEVSALLDLRMVESGQALVGDYIDFKTDVKIGKDWGEV